MTHHTVTKRIQWQDCVQRCGQGVTTFSRPAWARGEHGYWKLERAVTVAAEGVSWQELGRAFGRVMEQVILLLFKSIAFGVDIPIPVPLCFLGISFHLLLFLFFLSLKCASCRQHMVGLCFCQHFNNPFCLLSESLIIDMIGFGLAILIVVFCFSHSIFVPLLLPYFMSDG